MGNPLNDGTWTYTWEHGRQLASMTDGTATWTYTYDANGMRTCRSNGTDTYSYVYNGSKLMQMKKGAYTLDFTYDGNGNPSTVTLNGATYYYITNLQGDVIEIRSASGSLVCYYAYDAWGNIVSTTTSNNEAINTLNPLRYRGYVYDSDTDLYYLQSRYYNPTIGRFINADALVSTGQGVLGNNMFAYCRNNPANYADPSGLCGLCLANKNSEQFMTSTSCDVVGGSGRGASASSNTGTGAVILPVSSELGKETAALIVAATATLVAETKKGTQHVYILTDPNDDNLVKYVGRTNDPARRLAQHQSDRRHPERENYKMTVVASGLTVREARLVEQLLISSFTIGYLENARNEIAAGKISKYAQYIDAAMEIFVGATEDGIWALLGG